MTGSVCPKPGLAKRADNYEDHLALADRQTGHPELNRLKVDKALALGTADELSPQERCLMMALLAHLDIAATANGKTSVWPGSRRLCALIGVGESTLRRLKGSLEEKGFILRRYDRCNRPLKGGALDLSPFLARVEELCQAIGHTDREIGSAVKKDRSERHDYRPKLSARVPANERPIRNTQQDIHKRSPLLILQGTKPPKQSEEETAEFLCPGITEKPLAKASKLLGERKAKRLWNWARQRHGKTAYLALALATTDQSIKNPEGWFGWFATSSKDIDLREQITKLTIQMRKNAPPPTSDDPLHSALLSRMADDVGLDASRSYLSGAKISSGEGGRLLVRTSSRIAKQRLITRFAPVLEQSAKDMGFAGIEVSSPRLPAASHQRERRPNNEL